MAFYDLTKAQRAALVQRMHGIMLNELQSYLPFETTRYFSDPDTYVRKAAYLNAGRIFNSHKDVEKKLVNLLWEWASHENFYMRQTAVNAAGEIGKTDFQKVQHFFDKGLFDSHHTVRNAVIGSVKKMGEVNPAPVLHWAGGYLHHEDKEIRREICHGIELRGRKHPEDILPMLEQLQDDTTARVRNTLVHVIGQIAYKKGCLEKVVEHLKHWTNLQLVKDAVEEIIDVHYRYRNFSHYTQEEARRYLVEQFENLKI